MRVVTVHFSMNSSVKYERLLTVLQESIKRNSPNTPLEVVYLDPPKIPDECKKQLGYKESYFRCSHKQDEWVRIALGSEEPILFLDSDLMVMKELSSAFDKDFDIGYTKRKGRFPLNSGVFFYSGTPKAKDFMQQWKDENDYLLDLARTGKTIDIKPYGGINQASLYLTLSKMEDRVKIRKFHCGEWNACDEYWDSINDSTRIIHIKSDIRNDCLSRTRNKNHTQQRQGIIDKWNYYYEFSKNS